MRGYSRFALLLGLLFYSVICKADQVNLGFVSYDVLIAAEGEAPGVNVFNVFNFTGDPATGGSALAPDFPVYSAPVFNGATFTLTIDGMVSVVHLGDIGPGAFSSPSLEFPSIQLFSSAVFSATLSQRNLLLADGSTFVAEPLAISATIRPFSGDSL